ncbi:hypothetical protein OIU77_020104 [Salix suchowensis]|uniref:Uncharacterized protein n=1 Tax=Salix suchowensis TaxID=1278906 RepID=A0ABQ9CIF0_9ROSI|nr:hypothetical protein OIU77_020104 [Salix suchowensis]
MHFSILSSYGLAENGTFVSTAWRGNCSNGESFPHIPSHNKLLPCARLASQREEEEDMDIIVVDEDTCELVVDGMEGEIWVSSPSNCSGYLGHPSITREIFQARLREQDVIKLPNNQETHPHFIETAAQNSCQNFLRGGCLAAFEMSSTTVLVAEIQKHEKDVKFEDNNARFFPSFEVTEQVNVPEDRDQEISQAFSSAPRRPPLLSLL